LLPVYTNICYRLDTTVKALTDTYTTTVSRKKHHICAQCKKLRYKHTPQIITGYVSSLTTTAKAAWPIPHWNHQLWFLFTI